MIIARKYHIPPWEWRAYASEEDWATAAHLLELEAEEIEEARGG